VIGVRAPTALALASVALAACLAPPPPAVVDLGPPAAPPGAAAPPSREPPPPAPPALPPELAPPRAACVVRGRRWRAPVPPPELRPAPRAPAYATAWAGQAELVLADGAAPHASPFVRVEAGHVSVSGFIEGEEVRVAPARPIVVARFFVPKPRLGLEVRATGAAGVVVAPVLGAEAALDPSLSLEAVPCDALTLDSLPFDPRAGLDPRLRWAALPIGRAVPLAASRGAPPQARLTATDTSSNVEVLEVAGAETRIAWELSAGWITGWIPSAALVARREPLGAVTTVGKPPSPSAPLARVVCNEDVALLVETPAGPRVAGVARAGATLELLDRGVGTRKARVRDDGAATAESGGVSVREVDVERCRRAF
jgi:hypothetical protein